MSQRSRKSTRSCLFYGCVTVLVLMIVSVVTAVLLIRAIPSMLAERYTAAAAVALPETELKAGEYQSLTNRVADFAMAYVFSNAATLKLAGLEVNALIQREETKSEWKRYVRFDLDGGKLIAHFSIPAEMLSKQLPWKSLEGRHFNGEAVLDAHVSDGGLGFSVKSLRLNGRDVPGWLSARFSGRHLLKKGTIEPKTAEFIERIESVVVEDGVLIIRLKGHKEPPETMI